MLIPINHLRFKSTPLPGPVFGRPIQGGSTDGKTATAKAIAVFLTCGMISDTGVPGQSKSEPCPHKPNRRPPVRPPIWKGRRSQRIRSFRRPGGSGVQLASSDVVRVFISNLPCPHKPNRRPPVRPPIWKGRRSQRICSFRRPGGSGVQLASSDVVRVTGLEPARLAAREPKSRMSANSIIPAYAFMRKAYCSRNRLFLERLTRLELATSTLARWRSTG